MVEKRYPEVLQSNASQLQSARTRDFFFRRFPGVCFAFALSYSSGQPTSASFPRLRALVGIATSTKEQSIEPAPVRQDVLLRSSAGGTYRGCRIPDDFRHDVPRLIDVDACCAFVFQL